MKTLTNMLAVMGVCFVTLGLVVGGGRTAYAQTSPSDCEPGNTACRVGTGKTCAAPRACPGAGESFPNCDCK